MKKIVNIIAMFSIAISFVLMFLTVSAYEYASVEASFMPTIVSTGLFILSIAVAQLTNDDDSDTYAANGF